VGAWRLPRPRRLHTAYNDFEIVADNLLAGATRRVSDRIPCYGLFTDPPLGRAGMTETEALAHGHSIGIGTRPLTRVARAREKGETKGFMKLVVDAKTDLILGAALLGVGGDEAIHGVIEAMAAGLTASAYTRVVAIHPTVAELIPTTLANLEPA
jgi:pyruvate/2-oxoglutarate dehydrogenase complex dihydrolipoamide dehydrogenase (E3) component